MYVICIAKVNIRIRENWSHRNLNFSLANAINTLSSLYYDYWDLITKFWQGSTKWNTPFGLILGVGGNMSITYAWIGKGEINLFDWQDPWRQRICIMLVMWCIQVEKNRTFLYYTITLSSRGFTVMVELSKYSSLLCLKWFKTYVYNVDPFLYISSNADTTWERTIGNTYT